GRGGGCSTDGNAALRQHRDPRELADAFDVDEAADMPAALAHLHDQVRTPGQHPGIALTQQGDGLRRGLRALQNEALQRSPPRTQAGSAWIACGAVARASAPVGASSAPPYLARCSIGDTNPAWQVAGPERPELRGRALAPAPAPAAGAGAPSPRAVAPHRAVAVAPAPPRRAPCVARQAPAEASPHRSAARGCRAR